MEHIIHFINEYPWVIIVILGIAFYINIIILFIKRYRKNRVTKLVQQVRNDAQTPQLFLQVHSGLGRFEDIAVFSEDEHGVRRDVPYMFNGKLLNPALILPEGDYIVSFTIIDRDEVGYRSKTGPYEVRVHIEFGQDSVLVFDNETKQGYQEFPKASLQDQSNVNSLQISTQGEKYAD
ncbi:hypothetical protein EJ419_01850 [Alloscardovia theropitheci]|uniref:Uncharacterized protein n=1 Tax=Alloscardovia theropitheci TaxID=2496842 RepID=A0A4R0QYU2_9BIFI|nr:hypothetical protein [Alloscardovia theropitheci]TCD54861.1 hypothetical protein EJ419_01850 [Alloscardovia theropitheci]